MEERNKGLHKGRKARAGICINIQTAIIWDGDIPYRKHHCGHNLEALRMTQHGKRGFFIVSIFRTTSVSRPAWLFVALFFLSDLVVGSSGLAASLGARPVGRPTVPTSRATRWPRQAPHSPQPRNGRPLGQGTGVFPPRR